MQKPNSLITGSVWVNIIFIYLAMEISIIVICLFAETNLMYLTFLNATFSFLDELLYSYLK